MTSLSHSVPPVKFSAVLSLLLLAPLPACNVDNGPLTDPREIYERAVSLFNDQAYQQARPYFEQAIQRFQQDGKSERLAEAQYYLGKCNLELREFRAALDAINQGITLSKSTADFRADGRLTMLAGDVHFRMGNFADALASYGVTEALAATFSDETTVADAELRTASSFEADGMLAQAFERFQSALARFQSIQDRSKIAEALYGLGDVYRLQSHFAEALNSLTQALSIIDRSQQPLLASKVDMSIGLTHLAQNNINGALTDFRDATNVLRRYRGGRAYEVLMLFRIGSVYNRLGRVGDAKKYFTDALEIARAVGDRIAENYLYVLILECNLNLMTPDQRRRTSDRLEQSYEQIVRRFQECGHATGEGYLWVQLGKFFESRGDLARARDNYSKAVRLDLDRLGEFEDVDLHKAYREELGIKSDHQDWYDRLSGVLLRMGKNEEALKTLELSRTRQTFRNLEDVNITLRHPKVKKAMQQLRADIDRARMMEIELGGILTYRQGRQDEQRIQALRTDLDKAKQNLRSASAAIATEYPNYESLTPTPTLGLSGIQSFIPRGSLVVEFLATEDQLYIFAVSRSQFMVKSSPIGRDSLFRLMAEYKQLLQDPIVYSGEAGAASVPAMTRFAFLSTRMYRELLQPVDDLLDRNLIVVVSPGFENFPFHAIERQDRSGNVKYVIELTSVDYLGSLTSLRYKSAATSRIRDVVAFGNPTGKQWSVDYELRDIRSFFKGATIFIGLETSWNNVKSAKPDVLQLSTEYTSGSGVSPLGEITLSNGLMVEESVSIPFEKLTELEAIPVIVLSNQYGQGVGLTPNHAMLLRLNGTSDVFYNAWFADRKAAKFFSEFFYTSLSGGLAPGDAYRQALLNLIRIREVSHPRSWGQFFHFGVG